MYNSRLYRQLVYCTLVNILLSAVFIGVAFFVKFSASDNQDSIVTLYNHTERLYGELEQQKNINSNLAVFAFSLIHATSNIVHTTRAIKGAPCSTNELETVSGSEPKKEKNPYLRFKRYQEINDMPLVQLGNKFYRVGDIVDGEIITDIQPTYLKLGDLYYEIESSYTGK